MKYLLLIRHAKTEQTGYDHDFERELTERGINDCKIIGQYFKKTGFIPELVKISSSKRTRQTAKYLAKHLDWEKEIIIHVEKLYLASYFSILNEIAGTDNKISSLAIIGHNPGISELFNFIGNANIDDLPTCAIGLFKFDVKEWGEIDAHTGQLEWYSWPGKEK